MTTTDIRPEVIKDCFDLLSDFPHLTNAPEKASLFNALIDTLGGYPKARQKGNKTEPTNKTLGACLYVSNARNALTLGVIGCHSYTRAAIIAYDSLECALSLLIDKT